MSEQTSKTKAASAKPKNIYEALLAFQDKHVTLEKNAQNAHLKNKYADINEIIKKIRTPLSECGIVVIQLPSKDGLLTKLHHPESDSSIESFLEFFDNRDVQRLGSNITYYRRYALQSMLGLEAEDDDGEAAKQSQPPRQSAPKPAPAAPEVPDTAATDAAMKALRAATNLDELKAAWSKLPAAVKNDPEVQAMKEEQKTELNF